MRAINNNTEGGKMSSIGTGYHMKCKHCGKRIKGARYDVCKTCRENQKEALTEAYVAILSEMSLPH